MGDFVGSAVGDIKILEVNQEGKYVRLVNEGKQVRRINSLPLHALIVKYIASPNGPVVKVTGIKL